LDHIAATASAEGIPALELSAWAFNAEAQAAFQRLGFSAKSVRFERQTDGVKAASLPASPTASG
jgi:hypothetical protein